ncbi:MAG: glyceraldehyde 3-phosphate dehydrogenase NAD-binding domain-containing protein [Patescibacteria group bacterium]
MSTKVAINGFGRIGRLFFRQAIEEGLFEVVAINDLGDSEQLAYLLLHDSVYRGFSGTVEAEADSLKVNGRSVRVFQEKDPAKLPWKALGVDIAVEATGVFNSYAKAKVHLKAGAKRVVLTAPSKDEDGKEGRTVLMGVNDEALKTCSISSNGSCTTNAVSPVARVLSENPGIEKAFLLTTHGYTATQNLVDGPIKGSQVRRGRAAAVNIVPSSTGAATTVARAVKELEGKFDGVALRVPVPAGSIAVITFLAKRETTAEELNEILEEASQSPRWKGILKVTRDPVVSTDIIQEPYGAIVDAEFTRVVGGNLCSVFSWYDNEWGYAAMLIKHVKAVASLL